MVDTPPVTAESLLAQEPRLRRAVELAVTRLGAVEVWVFGSRARGDARPDSDWDLFVVLPDDAPESAEDPVAHYRVGRDAGLYADVLAARRSEVRECQDCVNTLAYELKREGVRIAIGGTLADDLAAFRQAWKRAERSDVPEPDRVLSFEGRPGSGGAWDDFFAAPGADLGERDQPPAPDKRERLEGGRDDGEAA